MEKRLYCNKNKNRQKETNITLYFMIKQRVIFDKIFIKYDKIESIIFLTGGENEETKLSLLKIYLIGDAREVFEGLSKDESSVYC